ncbi:MAG: response regulator [Anaerolineae bacterium]|nr:response regulator [Anaerolineae bacterium]
MTASQPERLQVIYVEDRALDAVLLRAGLATYHIDVIHLSEGDERLLDELSRSRYDSAQAIILDINIGELSGLQVARRLRAAGDKRPILIISSADRPSTSELMAVQAMFIAKPFDFGQISDTIKRLAARV